jgi:hypothetical protein
MDPPPAAPEQIIDFFVDAVPRTDLAQYTQYQRQAVSGTVTIPVK